MTGAQRKDVNTLISSFNNLSPQNLKIEEKSKESILVSFQLDDGPRGLKNWFFLGNWDGKEYQWTFQYEGMPKN